MKRKLIDSMRLLLVAAGLCVGASNAWADGAKRVLYSQNYESATSTDWASHDGNKNFATGDATYGNYAKCEYQGNGNRDFYNYVSFIFPASSGYTSADMTTVGYTVEFDVKLCSGNSKDNSKSQFIVTTASNPALASNAAYTGTEYIFSLSQPTITSDSRSTQWFINDLTEATGATVTLSYNDWFHVKLVVTATSVSYVITNNSTSKSVATGSKTVDALPTITGFFTLAGRGSGFTYFDNLEVYHYSLWPEMSQAWSMSFASRADVLGGINLTKSESVAFGESYYTASNDGFNSNFGVDNTENGTSVWALRKNDKNTTGLWLYGKAAKFAVNNVEKGSIVAVNSSASVTAKSNSTLNTNSSNGNNYVFQVTSPTFADFNYTKSTYVRHIAVYNPVNEVIGLLDKSSGYMGQYKSMSISKGEAINMHFKNRGNSDANAHNWVIRFFKEGVDFAFRADNWVNGTNSSDYCTWNIDMDGNAIDWAKFREQMQDAEVDMTVAYTGEGNFLITATSVCNDNTFHHSMNYKTTLSGDLSLELGVDHSWMEVTTYEKANIYTATFTANEGAISPVITIYGDAERTEEVTNGILYNGTYYYTAKLDGYEDYENSFTVTDANPSVSLIMTRMHSYTVKAYCGETDLEKTIKSGLDADGATVSYLYPHYILYNDELYYIDAKGSGNYFGNSFTLSEDDQLEKVQYTKSTTITNIAYLQEVEDIEGISKSISNNYTVTRASQGAIGYYTSKTAIASLEPGKYKIEVASYADNKAGSQRIFTFTVGSETVMTHTGNGYKVETSDEFTIYEAADISVEYTNQHSSYGLDYILIYKTGDASVSKTIGSYGYATFSSTYALDFTDVTDATAYIATSKNGDKINMQAITGEVAANTGLVLKSTSGSSATVNIPVAASGTTYNTESATKNYLFAIDNDYDLTASDNGTNYVLSVQSGKVVFAPIGATAAPVTAGHAALWLPAGTGARVLGMSFDDDETTGISQIENGRLNIENSVYNLNGQRVTKPSKGLYIVGGKKVILK